MRQVCDNHYVRLHAYRSAFMGVQEGADPAGNSGQGRGHVVSARDRHGRV